jgi:hypothetical protein
MSPPLFRAETDIVDLLVNLVIDHISNCFCPSAQGDAGVFCNVLVGFLRGGRTSTLLRIQKHSRRRAYWKRQRRFVDYQVKKASSEGSLGCGKFWA